MEFFFIVISSLLRALNAEAQVTATILPDRDYNAPLDDSSLVSFNCTATESIIVWLVDGTQLNAGSTLSSRGAFTTPVEMIGGGVFFSSLSIPTRIQNDNTPIQCSALRVNPSTISIKSKLVFLNIQGLLGPPPNLTLSEPDENYRRILSWDAPVTLDLTDTEPDILYYTVCYNISGNVNCTDINSNEERAVEFTLCNVSETLLFTVTAVNIVGEGNTSSIIYRTFGQCVNTEGTNSIKSVSGSVTGDALELSCTFANRPQTKSCILSVCRLENVNFEGSCINVTIPRDRSSHSLTSSEQLTNLYPGQYAVSLVGQMDDCRVTILRAISVSIILRITETLTDRAPPGSKQCFCNNPGLIIGGIFASAVLMFAIGACAIVSTGCVSEGIVK